MCKNKNDTSFEMSFSGAADRGRTGTDVTPTDFKSGVSANSTTAANYAIL